MNDLGNIIIENKALEGEQLALTDKSLHYFLGPHLTLKDCTLILKVPAQRLLFEGVQFIDCTFDVKQELKNHQQWVAASLKSCRFKGKLTGCDFGHWPEYGSDAGYQHGSIEDCDFTEAQMSFCRIMGSDPSTLRFPTWPCFTVLDPIGRAAELQGLVWPGPLGTMLRDMLPEHPPRTRAITYHAPAAAKWLDTTPEAIRAVLGKVDGILY